MTRIAFTKMHGIGNDYVYVDCTQLALAHPDAVARAVSPRRTGIGSDGLILICPSSVADCRMEMYNADGSRGAMCGNGIRCVGKYVYDHGICRRETLRVETDTGVKTLQLEVAAGVVVRVHVDMGAPILDGPLIPVVGEGRIINYPLVVDTGSSKLSYPVTCVSMGNPHCVSFQNDVEKLDLERIGPGFEFHPFFPQRVNTEFVHVLGRNEARMRVWERGSGETAACGTGACAVLVAGVLTGRMDRSATIHLNGGDLEIRWDEGNGSVYMTGAAEEVFRGEIDL